ncbi:MAG: glycine cleavage system aminomethyltransferase GcvT [Gammaproteobacteria bacterium]|nr:glycine cleavage system aminomethyltransferase GcvT [Gammaproteobacteria bacterium]
MSAPAESLKHTPLYSLHEELGARLVPFAGYALPVQYRGGIKHEHLATRARAGLFDVSHMGQVVVRGAPAALERLVPSDIAGLALGQQRYTLFTSAQGGVLDDLMVTRFADRLHLVVNAAFKDIDLAHLRAGLPDCEVEPLEDQALLALQGPAAARVLAALAPEAAALAFMKGSATTLDGVPVLVHRCGYTGEDGFEIAMRAEHAERVARRLLANPEVEPCGLGARDSLRLEAGLCLSGADLDANTSPVEAALAWTIARRHRAAPGAAEFPGAARILGELVDGPLRRRVGLRVQGRVPVRAGAELCDADGQACGVVTSGGFGPSLDAPIAMGYVRTALATPGTRLTVAIRNTEHVVEVQALPFVPHRYLAR